MEGVNSILPDAITGLSDSKFESLTRSSSDTESSDAGQWYSEILIPDHGVSVSVKYSGDPSRKTVAGAPAEILNTSQFGKVLVLDGVIMMSESAAFASVSEMVCHCCLAECAGPPPTNALVVGNCAFPIINEILKHQTIDSVTFVSSDHEEFCQIVETNFPVFSVAAGNADRVKMITLSHADFFASTTERFDLCFVSLALWSTGSPSSSLLAPIQEHLKEYGVAVLHVPGHDSLLLQECQATLSSLVTIARGMFQNVSVRSIFNPVSVGGPRGYIFLKSHGLKKRKDFERRIRENMENLLDESLVSYYTSDMHMASLILPKSLQAMRGLDCIMD